MASHPHQHPLPLFRKRTILLPTDVEGHVVDHQGRPSQEWLQALQENIDKGLIRYASDPRARQQRSAYDLKALLHQVAQAMPSGGPVVVLNVLNDDEWLIAFNAAEFVHPVDLSRFFNSDGTWQAPTSMDGHLELRRRLILVMADQDPVRYAHNHFVKQAKEEGLLDDANDPRLSDPLYREQSGLPRSPDPTRDAQPRETFGQQAEMAYVLRRHQRLHRPPQASSSVPTSSGASTPSIDRDARRRAYEALMIQRQKQGA